MVWFDNEVCERAANGINYDARQLSARAVAACDLATDREFRGPTHGTFPFLGAKHWHVDAAASVRPLAFGFSHDRSRHATL